MPRIRTALKVLAWMCRRPWEIFIVAFILLRAQCRVGARGRVRVLARAGGLGDVLWAAAAADIAARETPQDALLFLTQPAMIEAVRLASPGMSIIAVHLPNPWMQSILRRWYDVVELVYETSDLPGVHMVQAYLRQLGCAPELPPVTWHFRHSPDVRAAQPVACVYAGPSWAVREMPLSIWSAVVLRLRKECGLRVLQILPDEQPQMRIPECDGWVVGEPLAALCNLFNQSALVLTIDSIMLHLAAGTRAPLVGLFGPTEVSCRLIETSRRRGLSACVPCAGCHHRMPRLHWQNGCPHDIACMKELSPGMIMAAVFEVLSPANASL